MKNATLLSLILVFAGANAEAATLAPHRAIYDLSLLRANRGADLQSAAGKLAFEIQGSSCEGWTVGFRMATKYRPSENEPQLIDTQTTSYESPDGLDFRHQLKEIINGEVKQDVRIKVKRSAIGAEGTGESTGKSTETFTVPAEVALPMQHQLKLMALGETGGGRDSSLVYDGSDGGKSFRAISFVGKEKAPGSISRDKGNSAAGGLMALGSWPMTISYFPVDDGEDTPEYQVSFDMYANGVATGLVLDYGDFALSGTLRDLKLLDTPECP